MIFLSVSHSGLEKNRDELCLQYNQQQNNLCCHLYVWLAPPIDHKASPPLTKVFFEVSPNLSTFEYKVT